MTDSRRVYACVLSQMTKIMNQFGHDFVWLRKDPLYTQDSISKPDDSVLLYNTARRLDVDAALVLEEIANLAKQGKLILSHAALEEVVYLPKYYEAETGIATILKSFIASNAMSEEDVMDCILEYEDEKGFSMADRQREAVVNAVRNRLSIISGPPGSGKTTIIDCICTILKKFVPDVRICLAAPTGKAANRMNESTGLPASTIHRMLEYNPQTDDFTRNANNPIEADVLIVDEFSMNDTLLTYSLLQAVPEHCMVILVGDKEQLPSVGAGKVLEDLLSLEMVPKVILDKIYRQGSRSTILQRALDISREVEPDLRNAHDFAFYEEDKGMEHTRGDVVSLYDNEVKEWGIENVLLLTPMNKGELGVDSLNIILQDEVNPLHPETAFLKFGKNTFRLHDRVIQTVNEPQEEVFNGMVGTITQIEVGDRQLGTHDSITVDFGEVQSIYTRDRFENIKLAYALTIHKSQGSEAKSVIMLCDSSQKYMLRKKLIYTGMTRAKSRLQMIGQRDMVLQSLQRYEVPRNSMSPSYMKRIWC